MCVFCVAVLPIGKNVVIDGHPSCAAASCQLSVTVLLLLPLLLLRQEGGGKGDTCETGVQYYI